MINDILPNFEVLIASLAKGRGYDPQYLLPDDSSPIVESDSAALIYPATLTDKVGHLQGQTTSEIEFILLLNTYKAIQMTLSQLRNQLRIDAMFIVSQIECNKDVIEIEEITIEPVEQQLSHYDEAAVKVSVTIVSNFMFPIK